MSTAIRSFGQGESQTISAFENGNATVVSSFGPKSCLRMTADASMYSKAGGSIQIRGIGQKTFLNAKQLFFVQPVQFRLRNHDDQTLLPNQFMDQYGSSEAVDKSKDKNGATEPAANANVLGRNTSVNVLNGFSAVSNGIFKSFQSCVLSLNGSSWQIQPSSVIDAIDKIYGENRYDEFGSTACPPYTCAAGGSKKEQPGYFDRCQSFMQNLKIDHIDRNGGGAAAQDIRDIVWSCDLVSRIAVGPLWYAAYPALSNLTENSIECLPHVDTLNLEYTYRNEAPCQYWWKYPCTDLENSLAVDCSDRLAGNNLPANSLNSTGVSGIDMAKMWASAEVSDDISGKPACMLGIRRPYLSYVITEASAARIAYKPLYTIPSIRFTNYSQDQAILAGDETGTVDFSYIQVDNLSSLICVSVFEAERDGRGGSIGPRQPRFKNGTYVPGRHGAEFQNISCPIRWSSLKATLSVGNAILGSMTGGFETEMDQYRTFLQFSKTKVSFSDWKKYNQLVLISPMQLLTGGLGLVDQQVSLSVSFEFERCACDTLVTPRDWCRNADDDLAPSSSAQRAAYKAINYTSRLFFLHQEAVKLSPGQCSIEMISFTPQEANAAFTASQKTLEAPVLDQFVN